MRPFRRSLPLALAVLMVLPVSASAAPADRPTARKPIVIGLHAPMTGAVPLPSQSLQSASDIYWKWLAHRDRKIHGRNVNVVLKNDNTNPQVAAKACREMVQKDGAFLLAGVLQSSSGSAQSQSCARVAEDLGVPYVSLGGTTAGVERNDNHFVTSMTFRAQGRLLADYFIEKLKGKSRVNGLVSYNTPHEMEAVKAFRNRLEKRKADLGVVRLISRNAGASEAQAIATELQTAGVENAFVFTRPTFFIQLLQSAGNLNYRPVWSGLGISFTTTDEHVRMACNSDDPFRARFFSPLPAFDDRDEYDANFDRAMARIYPMREKDNIVWQGWATAKQIAGMLEETGAKLSTRRFISRVEGAGRLSTGIMPDLDFTAKDHFGASKTHVLASRCSDERWHTRIERYH